MSNVQDRVPDVEINDEALTRVVNDEKTQPEVNETELTETIQEVQEVQETSKVTEVKEPKESAREPEDVLHILEPRYEHAVIALSFEGKDKDYIQKPLTLFGKMQFFQHVGRTLDEAMKGENGLNVNSIFGADATVGELNAQDFGDLDSFLNLVSKIAGYAPDFLKECFLIWLRVPKGEREWAYNALDEIDDETGFEIVERFIDQNWEAIDRFFSEQVPGLFRRVTERRNK